MRGEIVVVVGGAEEAPPSDVQDLVAEVLVRADTGERLKDAVADVAGRAGVPKRALYEAALERRRG